MKKKTLKSIAKEADVSPAMVSQILNGTGRASDEVRNKILTLLEKYGYKPKYARYPFYYVVDLPQREITGKTQNVIENLSGVEGIFEDHDLTLHVDFLQSEPDLKRLKSIIDRNPSGVFINTDAPFLDEACKLFHQADIPIVQVGYDTENPKYNAVVVDGFSGAYTATQYLLNKGHDRIGIIRFTAGNASINSNKKFAGYSTALADHGLAVDKSLVKKMESTQGESGWEPISNLVEELLGLSKPPTALFIENSFVSLSVLYPFILEKSELSSAIQDLDIVVFEDWPMQPVNDIMSGKLFYPELESVLVSIDWENIGRQAAQLLIKKVANNTAAPEILRVNPTLYQVKGNNREPIIQKK